MKSLSLLSAAVLAVAAAAVAAEPSPSPSLVSLPADHPLVEGPLSKIAVHQVAFIHRNEIRACYEAALQKKPGIAGKVVAQFVVEPTGSVSHVRIAGSTLNDSAVENCVVNRVSHWRFPRPARRVSVTYPWTLHRNANG